MLRKLVKAGLLLAMVPYIAFLSDSVLLERFPLPAIQEVQEGCTSTLIEDPALYAIFRNKNLGKEPREYNFTVFFTSKATIRTTVCVCVNPGHSRDTCPDKPISAQFTITAAVGD